MRCEEVLHEFAAQAGEPVPDVVTQHLLQCASCRETVAVYTRIDEALGRLPVWEPPVGFAAAIGRQGSHVMRDEPVAPGWSWNDVLQVATSGALVGVLAWGGAHALEVLKPSTTGLTPATQALMWVGFAYAAGSWFAWRAEETGSATI